MLRLESLMDNFNRYKIIKRTPHPQKLSKCFFFLFTLEGPLMVYARLPNHYIGTTHQRRRRRRKKKHPSPHAPLPPTRPPKERRSHN
jgi:hypothetical protein